MIARIKMNKKKPKTQKFYLYIKSEQCEEIFG